MAAKRLRLRGVLTVEDSPIVMLNEFFQSHYFGIGLNLDGHSLHKVLSLTSLEPQLDDWHVLSDRQGIWHGHCQNCL